MGKNRVRLGLAFCLSAMVALSVISGALPLGVASNPASIVMAETSADDAEAMLGATSVEPKYWLPFVQKPLPAAAPATAEWSQHAHNAQRTGYTSQVVGAPWRWRWAWNGPNSSGGIAKVTIGGSLPRNVQPVTGGGRVYVAAGDSGVYALSETTGAQAWNRNTIGAVNSTVAYDHDTQAVFAVSADGRLYKLNAATGGVSGSFHAGSTGSLPLPPAVLGDRVLFSMGNSVFAVNKFTMVQIWAYAAGSPVETPPSYSASRDTVVVGTRDLNVHAINNANGARIWRVRPVPGGLAAGETTTRQDFAEYRYGWPVIADNAGYVLMKVRLDWQSMWTWNPWPVTNSQMRANLSAQPDQQALFVLRLDNGSVPFIANIGHGGYGDNDYMPMGPQPVVKRLANGKDVVYTIIRGHTSNDGRWDSSFGEMVLDGATVSGLQGGDVRFIAFDYPPKSSAPYLLTDEQPNVSMAGDYLFGGHWEAGFASRILDRSDARGSFSDKITTEGLATIATSQDTSGCGFSASHYCARGLENTRYYDWGFYIYYNQGAVYDRYWSGYSAWVVSNQNVYFRSTDGAIVALTSGNPTVGQAAPAEALTLARSETDDRSAQTVAFISHTEAREAAGRNAVVTGELRYVFNNGKQVMLGFTDPHQGAFKAIIRKEAWSEFGGAPEQLYRVGQTVRVAGKIGWYQGDPAVYVTSPSQIEPAAGAD